MSEVVELPLGVFTPVDNDDNDDNDDDENGKKSPKDHDSSSSTSLIESRSSDEENKKTFHNLSTSLGQEDRKLEVVATKWDKPNVPVILQFLNLTYTIKSKQGERVLLNNICGKVKPGRLLAIMGPTGSGKTTFLTALSGRIPELSPGSQLLVNGRPPGKNYKRQVAFVLQDDVLFGNLTVEQTLLYTAFLRLGELTTEEKVKKVNQVIDLLNLNKARKTIIGDQMKRGVSGGERKRVNIGNELLTQPSLILLDEPTSGLDTSTGINLLLLLKGMCDAGLTIVTAIHQPSSQMYALFDDLMILVEGNVTYNGPANKAVPYLASVGFKCSKFFNPADFIMGLILEEELQKQGGSSMKEDLIEHWKNNEGSLEIGHLKNEKDKLLLEELQKKQDEIGTPTYTTSYFEQVVILTRRSFYQTKGQHLNITDMVQTVLISICISLLWWQQKKDVAFLNDRIGVIFFISTYVSLFFPAFKALLAFPLERAVILRERTSGSYRLSAYFIAKTLTEIPFMWEHPLLMIIITYFTTALFLHPANFFIFLGVCLVSVFTSSSMGLLVSAAWGADFGNAQITLTVVAMMLFLAGGFFVQNIPYWMVWAYYISYIKYSTDALLLNEFQGSIWYNSENSTLFFNETIVTGEQILEKVLPVGILNVGLNVLILFAWGVFFRVMAFVSLQCTMKVPKPNSKKKKKSKCCC